MKILLAEDSIFMRSVLKNILIKHGFADSRVIEARNGQEALEKIKTENPDLVLLDIIMPKIDGMEILKQVGKTSKVVVISAVGQEKIMTEAKELGARDFIVKPFDFIKVVEVIKKVTNN